MHIKTLIKKWLFRRSSSYCLMFHHVNDGNICVKSGCVLSHQNFVDILDSGLEFISTDEYVSFSKKSRNKCAITFDDGLSDVFSVAYPELKKRQIPFTIFIIADFLDMEGYLTTKELELLASDPLVTIGSHGVTHDVLEGMSEEQQECELLQSKLLLEKKIKRKVRYFAFSHGRYDKLTLEILEKHQPYTHAFGVVGYPLNFVTKRWKYHLPRINCMDGKMAFEIVSKQDKKTIFIKR